jgi:hypothetical protein
VRVKVSSNAKCDFCEQVFTLPELSVKVVERDIHLGFFCCPGCNHEYKSYYTNSKIRTRQEKINEFYKKMRNTYSVESRWRYVKTIEGLVKINKAEMKVLRKRFDK